MPGLRDRSVERGRTGAPARGGRATLWALALALACGPPDDAVRPGDSASDPAWDATGVPLRVEDGPGWLPEQAWRLERDLVVGEVDGPLAFGRLADVAPRAAGGLWALDAQAARVRGFDGEGRETVSLGGRGDGPGELRAPVGVVETEDGRIAVLETFPPRITWFDGEGRPAGRTRLAASDATSGPGATPRFATWSVAADGTAYADAFGMPLAGGEAEVRHLLLRLRDSDGDTPAADTLLAWTVAAPIPVPGGRIPVLPARPSWALAADGSVRWTPGTPYEVGTFTAEGRLAAMVRRSVAAEPVTPAVRRALAEEIRRSLSEGRGSAAPAGVLERLSFPDRLPHVAGLWVSRPDGAMYVARYTASSVREGRARAVDAFAPDGSFLGEMALPRGFAPRSFTTEAAYGVWEDELGVPYAARYRIVRPGP